ncbi:pentapeptide repeat protein [Calothrix sp. PCC 7716]|nr:pentapeptide repeat protein [Calothrix sp. PCC 7716]
MIINNSNNSRFIETEALQQAGASSEQKVWDVVKEAFGKREAFGYWRYPIFSKTGETRKEPDILIVDKSEGIIIIEVKAITIDQIVSINGHQWSVKNFYSNTINPYQQAENQLYAILGYADREPDIRRQVTGRVVVALPLIDEKDWIARGFDKLPSCPPIIFKNQLGAVTILKRIVSATPVTRGVSLNNEQWERLNVTIAGTNVLRKAPRETEPIPSNGKTRASVLNQLREQQFQFDLQQVSIGMTVPPGAQRIRGIAGSGKTVLLAQKAAHIYLKHPDWDIAFVFFTRSLYDQITELIDKWMRHFSCGEVGYKDNPTAQSKLKVLHAWGASYRQGLYRYICQQHRVKPLTVGDTEYKQPNEGLADVCRRLFEQIDFSPLFDAILIDEGQDLVVDGDDLKFEDKQVIYWLAYKALRAFDEEHPEQRRLIWAYDEAQSLDTLKIPTAPELFGDDESFKRIVTGIHKGGIKKSEIMHKCYRTPAPILTAAHAIGMGLLRPDGMLSGLTRASDWKSIGYEIEGDFRKSNEPITLRRLKENSPNPVPELWGESVINFQVYNSRHDELTALANNIKYNLKNDGLMSSREILVVILGDNFKASELETHVASFLIDQGINIFIPSGTKLNQLNPKYPNNNPNLFWYPGGVTISRIHRAKGNEADMVYVVGLDNVAKSESNIILRNQLFVAMTRARGWVNLTGIGNYPMYQEIEKVIDCDGKYQFTYNSNRPPKRDMGSEEAA